MCVWMTWCKSWAEGGFNLRLEDNVNGRQAEREYNMVVRIQEYWRLVLLHVVCLLWEPDSSLCSFLPDDETERTQWAAYKSGRIRETQAVLTSYWNPPGWVSTTQFHG